MFLKVCWAILLSVVFLKVGWAILLSVMLTMLTSFASDSFCVETNIASMPVAGNIHSGTVNKDIYCIGIKDKFDPGHPAYAKIPTRVTIDIDCHTPLTRVAFVADILRFDITGKDGYCRTW